MLPRYSVAVICLAPETSVVSDPLLHQTSAAELKTVTEDVSINYKIKRKDDDRQILKF